MIVACATCAVTAEAELAVCLQVRETIRDVAMLHNESFFAAAQKKYAYIYDKHGLEVHCLKVSSYSSAQMQRQCCMTAMGVACSGRRHDYCLSSMLADVAICTVCSASIICQQQIPCMHMQAASRWLCV